MRYFKWLVRNHFEVVMALMAAIAVIIGIVVTAIFCNSIDNETAAVSVFPVCKAEVVVTETIPEPAPPPEPEPERNYFDVPLTHDVQDHIFAECEKHSLSPAIVIAMIRKESNFNTYCIGDDGRSAGLMQVQAKWHIKRMIALNSTDLFNPCQNVTVGIDYLAELYNKYGCDYGKALTAYNQGSFKGTVTYYAKSVLEMAGDLQ